MAVLSCSDVGRFQKASTLPLSYPPNSRPDLPFNHQPVEDPLCVRAFLFLPPSVVSMSKGPVASLRIVHESIIEPILPHFQSLSNQSTDICGF